MRKPFQGVWNIIRFNWHFYVLALVMMLALLYTSGYLGEPKQTLLIVFCILVAGATLLSLLASFYVYDLSGLYELDWISAKGTERKVINIHAGFDETSVLLQEKFKNAELLALDFYDPVKHTEVSIKRARRAYPPFPNTQQITSEVAGFPDHSADVICVLLSAHEIRNDAERVQFFKALGRIIKPGCPIYVMEHLRDLPNFLVYNIGFFHFHSKNSWRKTFGNAGLEIKSEQKVTPFISLFVAHA